MPHITISDITPRETFTVGAGGSSGPFNLPSGFVIFNPATDIKFYDDGVQLSYVDPPGSSTQFAFSGTLIDGGYQSGSLTLGGVATSGSIMAAVRDIPIARTTDFSYPSSTLDLEGLNTQLDKLFAIFQDRESNQSRALRQPVSDSVDIDYIPSSTARAGKFLAFASDGDPIASVGSASTGSVISAYAATFLDDATEAELKATINAEAGVDFAGITTANTFVAASQTFQYSDNGAAGPTLNLFHNSASPATNDILGRLAFKGNDSTGTATSFAYIDGVISDPTDGSEDGQINFGTFSAGTAAIRFVCKAGLYSANATGGDQGADTINASGYYMNGVRSGFARAAAVDISTGTGTTISSLPSSLNWISLMLQGVSLDDTDDILIQIGDSGGLHTTGYFSAGVQHGSGGNTVVTSALGFILPVSNAGETQNGIVTIRRLGTGNTWIAEGTVSDGTQTKTVGGAVVLDTDIDRVAILDTGGDLFDAGSISIQYG